MNKLLNGQITPYDLSYLPELMEDASRYKNYFYQTSNPQSLRIHFLSQCLVPICLELSRNQPILPIVTELCDVVKSLLGLADARFSCCHLLFGLLRLVLDGFDCYSFVSVEGIFEVFIYFWFLFFLHVTTLILFLTLKC